MKQQNDPFTNVPRIFRLAATAMLLGLGGVGSLQAQDDIVMRRGLETEMDIPADFHKYYGQRVNQWRDTERKIAKIDMDADLNYDGTINNDTASGDNGAFESTPPGLMVGVGELSKLVIRVAPYRIDFEGEVVIALELAGVNRAVKSGQFDSFDQEKASTGRIRVWRDAAMTELLLDSGDPEKRYCEWVADDRVYPANLPGIYPRVVYVEGVSVAPSRGLDGKEVVSENAIVSEKGVVEGAGQAGYSGDLRLLITASHRPKGSGRENYPEYRKKLIKAYRTSFDHMLFTVRSTPQTKDYINNNAEGVWLTVPASK
jgi:hypothetical protein